MRGVRGAYTPIRYGLVGRSLTFLYRGQIADDVHRDITFSRVRLDQRTNILGGMRRESTGSSEG